MSRKQIQKIVAGSRLTFPVTALYGLVLCLAGGVIVHQWWIQLGCFVLTTYLVLLFNNFFSLIRIYSRAITSAFIILSGVACFLFPSLPGGFVTVGIAASLLTLFATYQDKESTGWNYYTFLILGLVSLAEVHILALIPVYWVIMVFLSSLSLRTFLASLLGLLTPYWCWAAIVLFFYQDNFTPFLSHFYPFADVAFLDGYASLSISHYLTYAFLIILTVIGIVHYLRTSFNDKIRTRQFYYSIMFFDVVVLTLLPLFPLQNDLLLRPAIILTSPLIGHFIALTNTKVTNIAFILILIAALVLTGFNLWIASYSF